MYTVQLHDTQIEFNFSDRQADRAWTYANIYAQDGFDVKVIVPSGETVYVSTTPFWAQGRPAAKIENTYIAAV